jgi:hypothetical protein
MDDEKALRENSRALPTRMYGDPADVVERTQMSQLGCRACSRMVMVCGRRCCGERRNIEQKGFPSIGWNCRWFVELTGQRKGGI